MPRPDTSPSERLIRARTDRILERLLELHPKRIDLSLNRMRRLMSALGHPERKLPPVIHVAGTNGKGSTIAFMRAIAEAAGLRVHAYTSPHLVRFAESIYLAGSELYEAGHISEVWLAELLEECEKSNRQEPITIFEITTAAAFVAFSRRPADLLLLEVGLGGRLDSTNVSENIEISVITPIAYDHQYYLGNNLRQIAKEKAGIIRQYTPVVISPQMEDAYYAIAERANELGAPLFAANRDWQSFEQHGRLVWEDDSVLYDLPLPTLSGRFQYDNAALAIAAMRKLKLHQITEKNIIDGIKRANIKARMQRVNASKLNRYFGNNTEIWVDGAHNPHAASILAKELAELQEKEEKLTILVVGHLDNKNIRDFLDPFNGIVNHVIGVDIKNREDSMSSIRIAEESIKLGISAYASSNIRDALISLSRRYGRSSIRIVITGSLYLIGNVFREFDI